MAKKTGYHPDLTAKALVKNRRHVIGVVLPRESEFVFSNPIYASMIRGICSACTMHNYYILLSIGEDQDYSSLFLQKLVDGIVVVGNRIDDEKILDLMSRRIPFVVIPGYPDNVGPDVVSVDTENCRSVYGAVSYLIQLGHKRIAFISGHPKSKYSIERLRGYKAALKDSGIKLDPALALGSDFSKTDGIVLMNRLLDMSKPPTAVFFINAAVTLGALQVIHSRKLKVPADISVVSITGSDISDMFYPALTFVRTPNVEIGEKAGDLLIRTIEGERVENRKVVLPAEFVIRDSTAACRK